MDPFVRAAGALILLVGRGVDAQPQAMHPRYPAYTQGGADAGVYPDRGFSSPNSAAFTSSPTAQAGPAGYYEAPIQLSAGAESYAILQDPYGSTQAVKPKIYGLKTFTVGLLGVLALLYFSVFFGDKSTEMQEVLTNPRVPPKEKAAAVAQHVLLPFFSVDQKESLMYLFSWVLLLSGFRELISSFQKRRKARKGQAVPLSPPLRGVIMMHIGLIFTIVSLAGLLLAVHPIFLGLTHLAETIVAATFALVVISAFQKLQHKRPARD